MIRRVSAWMALPLVALALSACSSGATEGGESAYTQSGAVTVENGYVSVTDQQGSVDGFVGASEDAQVSVCEAGDDGWFASGEVTNPTDEAQSYRIYVAFNKNTDTLGLVQVDAAEVAPGATATWEATAPLSGDNLQCILRVERFTP